MYAADTVEKDKFARKTGGNMEEPFKDYENLRIWNGKNCMRKCQQNLPERERGKSV